MKADVSSLKFIMALIYTWHSEEITSLLVSCYIVINPRLEKRSRDHKDTLHMQTSYLLGKELDACVP